MPAAPRSDQRLEQTVGQLLRAGVTTASAVVLVGAMLYLAQSGRAEPHYARFDPAANRYITLGAIAEGVRGFDGRAVIQAGLLVLLATPIARVILAMVAFALERDWRYTCLTLVVLAILTYGLVHGYLQATAS